MKTLFTLAAIALAVCIQFGAKPAVAQWPQATSHEPDITIEFGGVVFDREGIDDPIIIATDSVTGSTLLSSDDATDLESTVGIQGKIVFPARRTLQTLELRGSYAGWDEDYQINSTNLTSPFLLNGILQVANLAGITAANPVNPILPPGITAADLVIPTVPLPSGDVSALSLIMPRLPAEFTVDGLAGPDIEDFFDAREITSRYNSDYFSIELMSRRNTNPGITWLFGPRFISISEDVQYDTLGTSPAQIFIDPATGVTSTQILDSRSGARAETRNSLVGLQAGLEYNMPVSQDVYVQISGRGGVFYNSMHAGRSAAPLLPTAASNAGQFSAQINDSASNEAYLAEFAARAYMDLIPNCVSAYAGFEGIYIDQLALAPAQLVVLDRVERTGDMFAKGLSFGLKLNR